MNSRTKATKALFLTKGSVITNKDGKRVATVIKAASAGSKMIIEITEPGLETYWKRLTWKQLQVRFPIHHF